jgi:hypothetical protein
MPVVGLQPCDRSKITRISTTQPQEGGFGKLQNLEFSVGLPRLFCGIVPQPVLWLDSAAFSCHSVTSSY